MARAFDPGEKITAAHAQSQSPDQKTLLLLSDPDPALLKCDFLKSRVGTLSSAPLTFLLSLWRSLSECTSKFKICQTFHETLAYRL